MGSRMQGSREHKWPGSSWGIFGIVSEKDKGDGQSLSSNCEYICDPDLCSCSKVVGYFKYFEEIRASNLNNNKYLDISKRRMQLTRMNNI